MSGQPANEGAPLHRGRRYRGQPVKLEDVPMRTMAGQRSRTVVAFGAKAVHPSAFGYKASFTPSLLKRRGVGSAQDPVLQFTTVTRE